MRGGERILVFVATKRMADQLTRGLRQEGWPALAIHGDKSQNERDWVLDQFKTGKSPLMIATDVAARGLDVKHIAAVINFDFPNNVEVSFCLRFSVVECNLLCDGENCLFAYATKTETILRSPERTKKRRTF